MFDRSADLYDAFYDALGKDYPAEARVTLRLARAATGRRPQSLLDVACGTGRHLETFAARVPRCVGVDVDPAMLAIARRRCPTVRFARGDMASLDLGQRFDIVTCLFSAIAYMGSVAQLRKAIAAMARHVEPGGALLVEPWFQPGEWDTGHLAVLVAREEGRQAVRVSRAGRRGDISTLDFDYLVSDRRRTRHFAEHHELRLFTLDQYRDGFAAAGLVTDVDEYGLFGRGLLVGVSAAD
jgi:ubiquinone/menaquinone biosynthesis C-methylase UbiE